MSQNINKHSGAPNNSLGSTGQTFEDLSGSLIYPGPTNSVQQNYQHVWQGPSGWSDHSHDNSYGMQYQTSTTDSNNYYSNHQHNIAPIESSINYYEIDKGGANMDISEPVQPSTQPGENIGSYLVGETLQPRLPDILGLPALSRPLSDSHRKTRGLDGVADSSKSKQDTDALNDRAKELRKRLLAKRGSTPVAPSTVINKPATPSNMMNKSNETKNAKTNETQYSARKMNNSQISGSIAEKALDNNTARISTRTNPTNGSPTNPQASSLEKANASTDIDRLLAEGRAAAAAEPTKSTSSNRIDSIVRKNGSGSSNEGLKNPSSEKTYSSSKVKGHQRNFNNSTSSSDMSELGEIRSDSGGALGAPPEPVRVKAPKDKVRPTEQKFSRQTYPNTNSIQKSMKTNSKELEEGVSSGSLNSKAPGANKTSPSDLLPSHSHDQPQSSKSDNHRDQNGQTSQAVEMRKELEQDRRQDADQKERNVETRRVLGHQSHSHNIYRDRIDHRRDNDTRRSHVPRYDVDESARAAAEYKRELEARRQQDARAAAEKSEKSRDNNKKDVEAVRPRTPEPKLPGKKQVDSFTKPEQRNEYNFEEKRTKSSTKELPDSIAKENITDVRDWLEMTGYFDTNYRNPALTRFRKIKALDLQRAELEREAQLEIERRSHFARLQSAMLREGVEASASGTAISPTNALSSLLAMPPPPPPPKQILDDIGIKIKDSANREGPSRATNLDVDKKYAETIKTPTQTLKRAHLDDDLDDMRNQPVEKLSRVDSNGRMSDKKPLESPTAVKGELRSSENRAARSGIRHPNDLQAKSRSAKSRSRSSSPVRGGRMFGYDQYVPRQRSRDPTTRRNAYSPDRQSNFVVSASNEKLNKGDRWCRHCEQPGHTIQYCFKLNGRRETNASDMPSNNHSSTFPYAINKHDIKKEGDQNADNIEDYHAAEPRPFIGHYQQYQPTYYRGRGRGGRGGFLSANIRGGYKPYRSNEETQDGQHSGGSASLNLQAGDSRYFMIKSWNSENVEIAQRDCTWATQEKNLAVLTEAFNTCRNVILVFSINNSRAFQGYARMTSLPGTAPTPTWAKELIWEATPPFHIQWITIAETRFNRVGHLKNSLNEMQAVLVGRDGQEIEGECGRLLCELIDEEGRGGGGGWGGRSEWATEMET